MNRYPKRIAPQRDPGGGVITPFEEWWATAKASFPNVPEDVARYWIHEHWGQSPYSYLRSSFYDFALVGWDSSELGIILSTWCDFDPRNEECRAQGRHLAGLPEWVQQTYKTPTYMREHGDFPTPIIVLDNRDGRHDSDYPKELKLPSGYILIEGHRRFNLALHLSTERLLRPVVSVWLMVRTASRPGTSGIAVTVRAWQRR